MELQKYLSNGNENKIYIEKTFQGTDSEYLALLEASSTVYIGGLPEKCREEQIWFLFKMLGSIKRIIMGVNKSSLISCGFCFVEYETQKSANDSVIFFKDFFMDGSCLKVNKDLGFSDGRQYGRGVFGGAAKADLRKKRRFN